MYKLVVLSSVLALAAAKPSGIGLGLAGLGWGAHVGAPWGAHVGAPWGAHVGAPWGAHVGAPWGAHIGATWGGLAAAHLAAPIAAPVLAAPAAHAGVGAAGPAVVAAAPLHGAAHNYRGPVSLAPGQPASLLATDGRPLDTLSVNNDRAVHFTARAIDAAAAAHGHHLGKRSAPLLGAAWSHTARIDVPAAHVLGPAPLAIGAAHLGWRAPVAPVGHLGHAGIWGAHW